MDESKEFNIPEEPAEEDATVSADRMPGADAAAEAEETVSETAEEAKEIAEETVSEIENSADEIAEEAETVSADEAVQAEDASGEEAGADEESAAEGTQSDAAPVQGEYTSEYTSAGTGEKKKKDNSLLALIAICLAIVACIVAIIFLNKDKKKTSDAKDTEAAEKAGDDTAAGDDTQPAVDVADVEKELEDLKAKGIEFEDFDYSAPFDENGHWADVKASDHVTLCEYKGIPVDKSKVEVTDDTVQQQIDSFLSQHKTTNQIKDRAVADGDSVNIDYVGSIDGVEFDGGNTGGSGTTVTIGVTNYIDDFLEQLIGHNPGDTFEVNVTFPEDYVNEEEDAEKAALFNGKDAVFVTTVNYIEEEVTPEFDDEFVMTNLSAQYGWKTAEEARKGIRDEYYRSNMQNEINTYLTDNCKVEDVPEVMTNYQIESMLAYYSQAAASYGMSFKEMIASGAMGATSVQALIDQYQETFESNAKYDLIMQAIAEDSGITFEESKLEDYLAKNYAVTDFDAVKETYGAGYLLFTCLNSSIMDTLVENAVVS